jgi:hypothetical protein
MKHPMRLSSWRQLLATFGAMESNSYVDVHDDLVVLSFGFFDDRLPRELVNGAGIGKWPRHGRLGWRLGLGGSLGLIGSRSGIVEIRLARPRRARGLIAPYTYNRKWSQSRFSKGGFQCNHSVSLTLVRGSANERHLRPGKTIPEGC